MGHSALGSFFYIGRNPARTSGFSYYVAAPATLAGPSGQARMAARKSTKQLAVTEPPARELDAVETTEDARFDRLFRPQRLADFIGQPQHRQNLEVYVKAAKQRGEPLDHILLCGPPGLGKTTLAYILAREMGVS